MTAFWPVRASGTLCLPLLILTLLGAQQVAKQPPQTSEAAASKISGPYTHENLTIFLIHGKDELKGKTFLTLAEALQKKLAVVHETKQVNELSIENLSRTEEVFVLAGDIVKGGQQDRIIAFDLIVPPQSKLPLAAFCVEAGRWQQRHRGCSPVCQLDCQCDHEGAQASRPTTDGSGTGLGKCRPGADGHRWQLGQVGPVDGLGIQPPTFT